MISLTNKKLKIAIINMLYMLKKIEKDMSMVRTEMKDINKAQV